jgi:hypothetical protein
MAAMIFAMASRFHERTAQRILKCISLLTLVETLSSAATYFATPVPSIIAGCLNVAIDGLIVFACIAHLWRRSSAGA